MNPGSTVTDQYKQVHTLVSELGKGGQGIVYTTTEPDIAVKLVLTKDGTPYTDKDYIKGYQNQLDNLLTLPVSPDINLARPICKLENHAGYVMQQLRGMKSVEDFFPITPKDVEERNYPEWLDAFVKSKKFKEAYALEYYAQTGSTKRRFEALMQCSVQLAKLHGQGLVYGDISAENVFFSENEAFNHVWFIDADNLRFENKHSTKAVYTPGFGAPELVLGQVGASTNTDVYSFAVLAFKLLSQTHPFYGEKLQGSDDWADETDIGTSNMSLEDQANAGLLPYVDDPNDDSNRSSVGLPRVLILSERLQQLFNLTFNKAQSKPWKRPLIYHWPKAFAQAFDSSIECPSCKMSYLEPYALQEKHCPYCKTDVPGHFIIERRALGTSVNEESWRAVRSSLDSAIILPSRLFIPFSLDDFDREFAQLSRSKEGWVLSLSMSLSEKVNVALNKSGEIFIPLVSKLELTEEDLKIGIVMQIEGGFPQQVHIMLKDSK